MMTAHSTGNSLLVSLCGTMVVAPDILFAHLLVQEMHVRSGAMFESSMAAITGTARFDMGPTRRRRCPR